MTRLLLITACLVAAPALGHEASDAPSHPDLLNELRGINQSLRLAQARLDTSLAVDAAEAVKVLNDAQVAYLAEDYPRAAIQLMRLVAQPRFDRHPAYPEALEYLGESLFALDLRASGREYLQQAVRHPRQLPTPYRRRLARLLELAGAELPLKTLRDLWQGYQEVQPPDDQARTREDSAIQYQYAKALVRHDALREADDLFAGLPEGDPYHLKALYFRGVIKLEDDDLVQAQAAFEEALAAWERGRTTPPAREYLDGIDEEGEARELIRVELTEDERLPPPEVTERARMGAVIHLALARLAAAREDDARAWRHYRMIPRGDPDFAAALAEGAFVLFRRQEYRWCVRLVDQLLAGRGDDVSAAQLRLWKAQLLARAALYEESKDSYSVLEAELADRAAQLDVLLEQASKRVFPQAVLAWTSPDLAVGARSLDATLVTQEEALLEAQETARLLEELIESEDLLPAVKLGREVIEDLEGRLIHFRQHLALARTTAHEEPHAELHGGGPAATTDQVARIAESVSTLEARVERFEGQLTTFERTYRARIASVLRKEVPVIARLTRELEGELAAARRLGIDMQAGARGNLEEYAAEARFGQVDIAWWRKDEITRKITAQLEAQAVDVDVVEKAQHPPAPPPRAAPPASPFDDAWDPAPPPAEDEDDGFEVDFEEAAVPSRTPPLADARP